ncbi:MAG: cache domain-containing protein [Candidatus Thiodiazotropha sp.]
MSRVNKTTGKPARVISSPIKDEHQRTKGVLAIGMSLADISDKIATTRFGDTGYAILLDQDGRVISHINEKYTSERTKLLDHPGYNALMVNNAQSLIYTNEAGKKVISQMRKTSHGWILLVQQDYDEAFSALQTYNQQTRLLMLLSLILVIVVAFLVARQLTQPIRQLTMAADAISRGNFDYQISDTTRGDELGDLARAVERLGSSVRLAMERFNR